jgi:hypothetical protein
LDLKYFSVSLWNYYMNPKITIRKDYIAFPIL